MAQQMGHAGHISNATKEDGEKLSLRREIYCQRGHHRTATYPRPSGVRVRGKRHSSECSTCRNAAAQFNAECTGTVNSSSDTFTSPGRYGVAAGRWRSSRPVQTAVVQCVRIGECRVGVRRRAYTTNNGVFFFLKKNITMVFFHSLLSFSGERCS